MSKHRKGAHALAPLVEMLARAGLASADTDRVVTLAQAIRKGACVIEAPYENDARRRGRPSQDAVRALGAVVSHATGAGDARTPPVQGARVGPRAARQVKRGRFFLNTRHRPEGVVYVELERPERNGPDAVLVWESDSGAVSRCLTTGVWLGGKWGSIEAPLLMSTRRSAWQSEDAEADILRLGRPEEHPVPGRREADTMCAALNDVCEPIVAALIVRGALRPFDAARATHTGTMQMPGGTGAKTRARARSVARAVAGVAKVAALDRLDPPEGAARTGLDALVESAQWSARVEGHNLAPEVIEMAVGDDEEVITGGALWHWKLGSGREGQGGQRRMGCPAAEVAGFVMMKALKSIGETAEEAPMRALLAPRSLRGTLAEAGTNETVEARAREQTLEATWYVENEGPRGNEPRALAMGATHDTERKDWALGLWTEGAHASRAAPFVLALGETGNGQIVVSGARLGENPERFEIDGAEHTMMDTRTSALLESAEIARGAIAHHVSSGAEAALARTPEYKERGAGARGGAGGGRRGEHDTKADGIFAIVRAAGLAQARTDAQAPRSGHGGGGAHGALTERHWVAAHWKRQRWGPEGKERKLILIAPYERGPEPGEDQVVMTRLRTPERRAGEDRRK